MSSNRPTWACRSFSSSADTASPQPLIPAGERDIDTVDYFRRRFRRIYPPFWAALVFTIGLLAPNGPHRLSTYIRCGENRCRPCSRAVVAEHHAMDRQSHAHRAVAKLASDWLVGTTSRLQILGPAWTLCYEEQFYVVCGIILLMASRAKISSPALWWSPAF